MRLLIALLLAGVSQNSLAGELRGKVLSAPKEDATPTPVGATPPTAWEIPQPLLPASKQEKKPAKVALEAALLVLIPQRPGKRPKPPQIVIDEKRATAKPDPAFIALKDTVTFLSRESLTLSFTEQEGTLLVSKKRVTKGFTKEGVYRYTAKELPALQGLVIVGTGARTQEVSGDFRVKGLDDGNWSVYLVTSTTILYAGETSISDKDASIEINVP